MCVNFIHFILFEVDSQRQTFKKLYYFRQLFIIINCYQNFCQKKVAGDIFFIFFFIVDVDVCHRVWNVDSCRVSQQTTHWTFYLYLTRICDKKPCLVKRRWYTIQMLIEFTLRFGKRFQSFSYSKNKLTFRERLANRG